MGKYQTCQVKNEKISDQLAGVDYLKMFRPKLFDTLQKYTRRQFYNDCMAGIIVGIVALPLAIAFAIASGVSPEKGVITAIVAGFIISALGGSKVQIGGPTGAFIIIVYGIVQQFGTDGLIIATLMAGIMLIIMGIARLGVVIKYIPYPLIVGFTSGIAVLIFSSQVKSFTGLDRVQLPADFAGMWKVYLTNLYNINFYAVFLALISIVVIVLWPKISHKIPGSLMAIFLSTFIVQILDMPVETIGSIFGEISSSFTIPDFPDLSLEVIRSLVPAAFTIAMLAGIESLLSAVVADGMTGGRHRSNMELIAQGIANVFSSIFGGIPATGAIARTATNIKNGGRTPVAGIIHSIVLLIIMLFFGRLASYIPMAALAGILMVVAYNMSEWRSFVSVARGPKADMIVLLTTFVLTVVVDLTVAIEIGMILAVMLFMRSMIKISDVRLSDSVTDDDRDYADSDIPGHVEVFEITGPFFFGAAHKFKDAITLIEKPVFVLILRMQDVPMIDATGIYTLKEIHREMKKQGTKLILSEVNNTQVMKELRDSRLLFKIGKGNVFSDFSKAMEKAEKIVQERLHG